MSVSAKSTRERKIAFIKSSSLSLYGMSDTVIKCLARFGTDWLTDEQLEDMCRVNIEGWKFSEKINRENRRRRKLEAAE